MNPGIFNKRKTVNRRNFINNLSALAGTTVVAGSAFPVAAAPDVSDKNTPKTAPIGDREYWISLLDKIALPVLSALSQGKLKATMPVEAIDPKNDRVPYSHLEALGRLLCGIAPWLELGPDNTKEGKLREKYIDLTVKAVANAVDPSSPDFMNFERGGQPLVDAAFLAQGFIRAPRIYQSLPDSTKAHLANALLATRKIKPYYSNWLLFSASIEAAFIKFDQPWDHSRIEFALHKHEDWYVGDGHYGDGEHFHWDYYNSYVIQPMLIDILKVMVDKNQARKEKYDQAVRRAQRYAAVQERLIAPDGTFPPIGRSICYRAGAFQVLSQIALMKQLPETISPAQVRSALTAVLKKTLEAPGTFDKNGWLTLGLYGHQPSLAEGYVSTGSLYLTSFAFLPLGLPATDNFWTDPAADWTSKKIWSGQDMKADKAQD